MAATQTRAAGADDPRIPDGLLDHLSGLEPLHRELSARIPDWHPRNDADADADADQDTDKDADADQDTDKDADADKDADKDEPDWKAQSRKHEARSKSEKKRADELQAKIDKIEESGKTDQQKAIDTARAEAKAEVETAVDSERRSERLEGAVIKQAAKAIKVGDDEHRFADIDDAQVHIDRALAKGDLDADTIFDDKGKVQTDALVSALAEILKNKPHLRATGKPARGSGSSDAGRGSGAGDLDDGSVEAQLKQIRRSDK